MFSWLTWSHSATVSFHLQWERDLFHLQELETKKSDFSARRQIHQTTDLSRKGKSETLSLIRWSKEKNRRNDREREWRKTF